MSAVEAWLSQVRLWEDKFVALRVRLEAEEARVDSLGRDLREAEAERRRVAHTLEIMKQERNRLRAEMRRY